VIPFNLADIGEAIAEVQLVSWCVGLLVLYTLTKRHPWSSLVRLVFIPPWYDFDMHGSSLGFHVKSPPAFFGVCASGRWRRATWWRCLTKFVWLKATRYDTTNFQFDYW
jgi:hypothetical protein